MPIITGEIALDSVRCLIWTAVVLNNALDVTDFHHHRVNHSKLFARVHNPVNGIENLWGQAKRVLKSVSLGLTMAYPGNN